MFKKRLIAAMIDYVIVYMVSFAVCFLFSTTVFKDAIDQQTAPFAVIVLLLSPFFISAFNANSGTIYDRISKISIETEN